MTDVNTWHQSRSSPLTTLSGSVSVCSVVSFVEIIGYVAAGLVVVSFTMKTMLSLRYVAVLSNFAFLTYGFVGELWPVFGLHLVLLPLNLIRIRELRRLLAIAEQVDEGTFSAKWLLPYGKPVQFNSGDIIFAEDEPADALYLVVNGRARVERTGALIGSGELLGEIGLFTPTMTRTATVVCDTAVEAVRVSSDDLWQVYQKDPAVSFQMTRLMVQRLVHNEKVAID